MIAWSPAVALLAEVTSSVVVICAPSAIVTLASARVADQPSSPDAASVNVSLPQPTLPLAIVTLYVTVSPAPPLWVAGSIVMTGAA